MLLFRCAYLQLHHRFNCKLIASSLARAWSSARRRHGEAGRQRWRLAGWWSWRRARSALNMAGARVIIWFESSCRLFSHFTPHSARPAPLHYFVIIVANGLFAYWLQLQKAKCGPALDRLVVATRPQLRSRQQSQLFPLSTSRQCKRERCNCDLGRFCGSTWFVLLCHLHLSIYIHANPAAVPRNRPIELMEFD